MIANIAFDDALILSHRANPRRIEFSGTTGLSGRYAAFAHPTTAVFVARTASSFAPRAALATIQLRPMESHGTRCANTGDPNGPLRPFRYEIARALIHMMARSTRGSNQRPDTLMQDRTSANSMKVLLQRTAGPYIRVKTGKARTEQMFSDLPPKADLSASSWHVA
jgi:hypothetical protein